MTTRIGKRRGLGLPVCAIALAVTTACTSTEAEDERVAELLAQVERLQQVLKDSEDQSVAVSPTTTEASSTTATAQQEDLGDVESVAAAEERLSSFGVVDPDVGSDWVPAEIASTWLLWMEIHREPISRTALIDDLVSIGFSIEDASTAVDSLGLDEAFHAGIAAEQAVNCCSLDGLIARLERDGFESAVAEEQGASALSGTSPAGLDAPSKAAENAALEIGAWLTQQNLGGSWYSKQRLIEIFSDPVGEHRYSLTDATWGVDALSVDWPTQALAKLLSVEPFASRDEALRWLNDEGFEYEAIYAVNGYFGSGF